MIERRRPSHPRLTTSENLDACRDNQTVGTTAHPLVQRHSGTSTSESFLAIVWRGRWVVLVCTIAALGAGLAYISVAVPIYTSTARLYLHCESVQISQYETGTIPRTDKYLHTQAEVLRSRDILLAALGTEEDLPLRTFAEVELPVTYLRKNMAVDVGRKDEIISVSFESPYPLEATQIVNRVVEAYLTSRSESERQDITKAARSIKTQLEQYEKQLKAKSAELRGFRAHKMPVSRGVDDGASVTQGYMEARRDYRQAQFAASRATLYLEGVRAFAENPEALRQYVQTEGGGSSYAPVDPARLALETTVTELERKKTELLRSCTEDHQAVRGVDVEIERVREELADLDRQFVENTRLAAERQYVEAKADEEILAEQFKVESANLQQHSDELQQFQELQAEVNRLEVSVATYRQQDSEISKMIGEDPGRMRMALLEPAVPAQEPSAPQKSKIMALALMLGLVTGGAIAAARDRADQTFRSVEEISATLVMPVLGVVPVMPGRQKAGAHGQRILTQPDAPEAEAYRTVRTAIFFGTRTEGMRTLLVTSPAAGDGKSTLVGNLAIAMAQAGQKTLILDADLRKPMQHVIFATDHHKGNLNSVFAEEMELEEAIQPTQIPGLSLLTCAYGVSNPAELLNSDQFADLLKRLAESYDRVIVDAPPVTVVTDAQILGALCDHTILVMRVDKSSRKMARRATAALESVGANLFGIVINAVRNNGDSYGYYGRYGRAAGANGRRDNNGRTEEAKGKLGAAPVERKPSVARS